MDKEAQVLTGFLDALWTVLQNGSLGTCHGFVGHVDV